MKVFTKYLLTLLLLGIASVVNASEYEIDQKFTSLDALEGQLFAIVNETDGMAIYNKDAQNLGYSSYSDAVSGTAYLWKIHSLADEADVNVQNAFTIEAVTADGSSIGLWGNPAIYLNSGAEGGFDGCFLLGNNNQYGTDVMYGGAWEIEYAEGQGFALKNVARGGYFAGVSPAPTGEEPIYWTFCSLKEKENTDPLADEKETLSNAIALGKMYNGLAYTEESFFALQSAIEDGEGELVDPETDAENLRAATTNITNAINALALEEGFTNLTREFFMYWDNPIKPTTSEYANCEYELFVPSGCPFGDASANYLRFVNLMGYDMLYITYVEGTPRLLMNRDIDGGGWNEVESDSHMIEFPKGDDAWSAKYFANGNGILAVDLKQIIADKGFATLNAIKGANWQNVTITGLYLVNEAAAPAEFVTIDWVAGDQGYENSQDLDGIAIALDSKTTMTCEKGTGSTTPKYYTSGSAVRTYGGNTITFTGEGITKIVITGVSGKVAELTANTGELTTDGIVTTWKGEADEIILTNETKNQQHIAKLHVVYGGIEEDIEPVHIANTIDDPYSVAKVVELIEAGDALDETVFVKGIISKIEFVNEEQDYITYWISDDGTTENQQFECYKGKTMEGLALADIEVGAEVIATGTLAKYNNIYEFAAGNALVSYLAPAKPLFADGTYYIYNIGTGKYLAAGSSWGTHAIVNEVGLDYGVKFEDGKYTLDSQISNGGDSHFLNGEWNDGAAMGWTFVAFDNAYYITDGTRFLTADEDGIVTLADSPSMASQWQLRTLDNRLAEFANASAENPVNATFLIPDANFGRNDLRKSAWLGDDFSVGGDATNMNAEKWGGNSQTFNIYQKLNVPDGLYRLTWNGYYRYNNTAENTNDVAAAAHADGSEVILSYVYMNDKDVALTSIADETAVNALGMMPFSQGDASNAFGMGLYEKSANVIVSDGMLIIGIKKIDHIGTDWTVWDNFRLTYLGEPIDINPDDPELEAPEGWINLIANGNLASDDVSSFVSKEYPSVDMIGARIVEGAGFNNSRGIVVRTPDETTNEEAQAWDSQFWIKLSEPLPQGTILHVEFDYKTNMESRTTTQVHREPGNYLFWVGIGDVNFVQEWQHFSADIEVTNNMADMQSIAFNLNEDLFAVDYFFDNFGVWAKKPKEPVEGYWASLIDNGNLENEDNHNYYTYQLYGEGIFNSEIIGGVGVDESRGIAIKVGDRVEDIWENQFYVYLNEPVAAGTRFRLSFDYRADVDATVTSQAHAAPGDFIFYQLLGDLEFTEDWQTFAYEGILTSEVSKEDKMFQSAAFNLSQTEYSNTYYFDNLKFEIFKEGIIEDWTDIVVNGDMESSDTQCFYVTEQNVGGPFLARISNGVGMNGSRGIMVQSADDAENDWDTQFFVRLPYQLPAGTPYRFSFDFKADKFAEFRTESHAEPSEYIWWEAFCNSIFDTEWQTYECEGVITNDMSTYDNMMQTIAFDLALNREATKFVFDNIKFEIPTYVEENLELNPAVDPEYYPVIAPAIVKSYPGNKTFNVWNGIMEFNVTFDKPVNCESIVATLNDEPLTVIPNEGVEETIFLARTSDTDLADGNYTIFLKNVYPAEDDVEGLSGEYSITFTVGPIDLNPEVNVEDILADNLWDATPEFGVPVGYIVDFNGEVRTSDDQYGSGPRMFVFAEGGDFTHGLYFREGYTQYGSVEDYPLYLEAGKEYTINFKSAMWKENGQKMNFQILNNNEDVVFEQTIENNPNLNGDRSPVEGATNTTIKFVPDEDGNYLLRWVSDGFSEVLLANPTVKYYSGTVYEEVVAFFEALNYAKQVRDANAESYSQNEVFEYLNDQIEWAEAEYQYFSSFNEFLETANNLDLAANNMRTFHKMYDEYLDLGNSLIALHNDNASTKFVNSWIYQGLNGLMDRYVYNGRIQSQFYYNDLYNAYSELKYYVNLAKDMFTEGPSEASMTGYAVLTERIRQGAETMRTLGIENEDLLWAAEYVLEDEYWLVDEIKQSIKNELYSQLKNAENTLFDPIIDEETGEEITPEYNMSVYVENPNIYRWGTSSDYSVPGWHVENANTTSGWTEKGSWDVPVDAMFSNWGGYFWTAQGIDNLPAGTYTVKFAVGERDDNTYTDSYAFVYADNAEYTASIDYIGQTFPTISRNNGVVTIENVVVTNGWMEIGVEAAQGSHLFFNEVQLLLTAPAPGYDYRYETEVLMGDVNLDGEVTTSDAVATVDIALNDWYPGDKAFRAADVNYTGNITVSDVVGIVNIILNDYEWYTPLSRGEAGVNYLTQDGTTIGLMNTNEFVAFQMDVTLADGAVLNNVMMNQRAQGLNVRFSRLEGNTYRIMGFSMNKTAITGSEGELLKLDITGNQNVTISNVEFTDTAANAYALGVNDATGINGIMAGDANADYYTVDGVKNNKMRKGMNVVKTADGKVRKMFVK